MSKPKPEQLPYFSLLAVAFILGPDACIAIRENKQQDCGGSSLCGNLTISYPFRLKSQPKCNDADHRVELECGNDNRTLWVSEYGKFYVQEISYSDSWMRLIDASLDSDNCSLPHSDPFPTYSDCTRPSLWFSSDSFSHMYLVNCSRPLKSSLYVDASRCTNSSSSLPSSSYFYFLDQRTPARAFSPSCTVIASGRCY